MKRLTKENTSKESVPNMDKEATWFKHRSGLMLISSRRAKKGDEVWVRDPEKGMKITHRVKLGSWVETYAMYRLYKPLNVNPVKT